MSKSFGVAPSLEALKTLGIDIDALTEGFGDGARVVVVQTSMEDAINALGKGARDQVIMTRIGADTAKMLDRWVDAGIARSRSEAAALFLQEGLKLREPELSALGAAIDQYEDARTKLRAKAQEVMGSAFKPGDSK